jgi:plastocyanin
LPRVSWGVTARISSVAAVALVATLVGGAAAATGPAVSVPIVGPAYQPGQLTVGVGQKVVWQNHTHSHHTVTSVVGLFNSGPLSPGSTYSITFTHPGVFRYKCLIHPTMKGTVVVLDLAPGTLRLRLSARGGVAVAHVQAARSGPVQLQASSGSSWLTVASGRLDTQGQATLILANPAHRSLRVELPAALGQPRELSRAERSPV